MARSFGGPKGKLTRRPFGELCLRLAGPSEQAQDEGASGAPTSSPPRARAPRGTHLVGDISPAAGRPQPPALLLWSFTDREIFVAHPDLNDPRFIHAGYPDVFKDTVINFPLSGFL